MCFHRYRVCPAVQLEKQIKAAQEVHAAEAERVLKDKDSARREVEMLRNLADDATLAAAQMRTELDKANAQLKKTTVGG